MAEKEPPKESKALTVKEKAVSVRQFIFNNVTQIKEALPRIGLNPESVARAAYSQVLRNPQLLDCDQGTLMRAILEAAQLGLSFNLGRAYLVPFMNRKLDRMEVQLIPGYLGLLDIARRSGEIASISARAVFQGDVFTYRFGLERDILEHDPIAEPDPAKLTHVYAIVRLVGGGYQLGVMTRKQVDAVRARSKASASGPWVTDYVPMAIKSVLKQVIKLCPASIDMIKAIGLDDARDQGHGQHLAGDIIPGGDEADYIDVDVEEEEPKPSRSATVKEALKGSKKESDRTALLLELSALQKTAYRSGPEAEIAASEATGGKIRSLADIEGASIEQLQAILAKAKEVTVRG